MNIDTLNLKYLTNPNLSQQITSKISNTNSKTYSKEDLKYYRKKIFESTRDFLIGKDVKDEVLNNIFDNYIGQCITHLKFKDVSKIIQNDYVNIKDKCNTNDFNSTNKDMNYDNIMMKKKVVKTSISNFAGYKNKKKEVIIPQVRNFKKNTVKETIKDTKNTNKNKSKK